MPVDTQVRLCGVVDTEGVQPVGHGNGTTDCSGIITEGNDENAAPDAF
jgi:hypothetical protein